MDDPTTAQIDRDIGDRIRGLRGDAKLTLEALAERSGVSRAMLSRIERGESSPTAQLLNRVCAGLGVTLSALFASAAPATSPLRRRVEQATWTDPGVGYARRVVSPDNTGSASEIVEVEFPASTDVSFAQSRFAGVDQHVVVLAGTMEMTVDDKTYRLEKGDCLYMRLDQSIRFHNPTQKAARYFVVLSRGAR
ncbi:MAG TPA: XRE family transcriptional regulator [Bauldia sp.]|nr:XRE family transcriptional regulator [Bauldia sp.]